MALLSYIITILSNYYALHCCWLVLVVVHVCTATMFLFLFLFFCVPAWRVPTCMVINVSVQYNGGLLPDILLLTQCYHHRGRTRLNAMERFSLCSLTMIPPKRFDIFPPVRVGCSEGLDAFRTSYFLSLQPMIRPNKRFTVVCAMLKRASSRCVQMPSWKPIECHEEF